MRNLRDLSRKLQCFSNKCEFVKCTTTNQVVDYVTRIIIGGTNFNVPLKLFSFKGSHLQSGTKILFLLSYSSDSSKQDGKISCSRNYEAANITT